MSHTAAAVNTVLLVPFDASVYSIIRVLQCLEQHSHRDVVLYCLENVFPSASISAKLQQTQVASIFARHVHRVGHAHAAVKVLLDVFMVDHDDKSAHLPSYNSIDEAPRNIRCRVVEQTLRKAHEVGASVVIPAEWNVDVWRIVASSVPSYSGGVIELCEVCNAADIQRPGRRLAAYDVLAQLWNGYSTTLTRQPFSERLAQYSVEDLQSVVGDFIPVDPLFPLWSLVAQCPMAVYPAISQCHETTCVACCLLDAYIVENCVPETVIDGAMDN